MGRASIHGKSLRIVVRLPLLWQWLLTFVLTVMVLRHWRWIHTHDSLDGVTSTAPRGKEDQLPGQQPAAATDASGRRLPSVPPRECPVSVPWNMLPRDPAQAKAAVFTPYNIVFGGGERYLLSVVAVMQEMGYSVDVLVFARNVCRTKEALLEVAAGLRVKLDPALLDLHQVSVQGINIQAPTPTDYSVFMSLGNDKLPTFAGLGHVNFYMCQFPFDLHRAPRAGTTKSLASYDYVLLNSGFTDRWYSHYAGRHIQNALRVWGSAPTVAVLHPPVEPFSAKLNSTEVLVTQRQHIVLLGRFFKGRQSKGHAAAISIFQKILPSLPPGSQLHLIGNLMPTHSAYLRDLQQKAAGLPVHFHIGVPSEEIEHILHDSLVQWHLTGIELEEGVEDPASEEHFGISVAEGMTAGVIPVVLNRGGVGDIVKHGTTGFLGADAEAIAQLTQEVFNMDGITLEVLRRRAAAWVQRFSQKAFAKSFRVLAHRGALTKPFRFLQQQTMDVVVSRSFVLPQSSPKAALIIEPRQHYAFEYVVKNVLFHLGPDWSLHVYHGTTNEEYVQNALESVENVIYRPLDAVGVSIPMLNQLLKSSEFWGELEAAGVQHVLFFQTDSLLLHGGIQPFLQYDYVGAPWHKQNERWGPAAVQARMPQGVGNGGLSLRSIRAMVGLSRQYGNNRSDAQQEDFFYSGHIERLPDYQVAPRQRAYSFCVEVPCDDLEAAELAADGGATATQTGAVAPHAGLAAAGVAVVRAAAEVAEGGEEARTQRRHRARKLSDTRAQAQEHGPTWRSGALLQTLPDVPMALHASWYYFWGSPQRFLDLLTMLEISVCGPEAYGSMHGAAASPQAQPLWESLWQQSRQAAAALEARRPQRAKRAKLAQQQQQHSAASAVAS